MGRRASWKLLYAAQFTPNTDGWSPDLLELSDSPCGGPGLNTGSRWGRSEGYLGRFFRR